MTLLVAIKGEGGLVLAADSRGTFGDPRGATAQNDSIQKAHVLAAHVGILVAGAGELGATVLKETKKKIDDAHVDGVTAVTNVVRDTVRDCYNNWFPSVAPMAAPALAQMGQTPVRPDLSFLLAGFDPDDGSAHIFSLTSAFDFAPMLHDYGFAVQGVPVYALYLLNRLLQPGRTVEELTALAVYVITETASQDGKVGGPVNVITVRPDVGCATLSSEEVAKIQEGNEKRSESLRDSFFKKPR